ncbi:chromatin assembly factor 1 subunit A isoform X3 [Fukomys damarensis]|uniref:chromatin assembly factor 1 subunit A isoform X3 n=1 Tax=Fukomys damarensis TaxID=885580 RepID=UPI00053FE148|nr:chromatin assembly factor 1 subunit A isoform X3 [Fukomys damarensis]
MEATALARMLPALLSSRAMDCKDRPTFPAKKLVQARLPFKRLNAVHKEKAEDELGDRSSLNITVEEKVADTEASLDILENDCPVDSDLDFRPKLINGKGPLDNFIRSEIRSSLSQSMVIIDLTEDSSDQPESTMDHESLNPKTSLPEEAVNGLREEVGDAEGPLKAVHTDKLVLPEETLSDIPCKTEEEHAGSGDPDRSGSSQDSSPQSCPKLPVCPSACPEKEQDSWSDTRGLLFRGKVPVVVLQDILAVKPPCTKSPPSTPLDKSGTSESELLESCPEEDSVLSHSSLSSSPLTSPEGPTAPEKPQGGIRPSPAATPVRRITKKCVKGSTEKSKLKLQRGKEQLREEKEKLKEEARRAREEARRRKEQEKELKEKERRRKREKDEKERAEKQRLKEERRKERQEALEAKLEEKRKKEKEKRLREEEKRLKAEKAEITRFFQKPKTPQAPKTLAGSCGKFAPFEIKERMVLAPWCRATLDQDLCDRLDQLLQQQSGDFSFLRDLRGRQPLRSGPTGICSRDTDTVNRDVVIVETSKGDAVPERRKFGRMKLLQFSENHRPAYWGTWNKRTAVIRPRDPWAQDKKLLDYEVDSDEEWEEEEPGESLSHSEGDDDDEVGEDEDDDDGFFVPHGYLSEDEGVTEECGDPEKHKVRQKLKAKEWDEFLAKGKRVRVLQPVKIGCVWADSADCSAADLKVLQQFTAWRLEPAPSEDELVPKATKREKRDQQILAQLLPLLHGNVNGSKAIIREFQEHCRRGLLGVGGASGPPSPTTPRPHTPTEDAAVPSKARLKRIISENSVYEKRPDFRMCWYVRPQVLHSFNQEHLPVPCQWSYVTMVPSAPREDSGAVSATPPGQVTPVSLKRKSGGSMCITQFMKKRRHDGQIGVGDMDGFQGDTEEEEEEDGDCMIVEIPGIGEAQEPCGTTAGAEGAVDTDTGEGPLPASPLGAS